jgi:capsular exopolysaccharide synthesis family protein
MRDFISNQLLWKTQSASDTEAFIAGQLDSIKSSLADADQKLAAYQAQTGILDVPQNAGAVISQLSQYEVQRTNLALQQEALQQLSTQISQPHDKLDPYLIGQANDAVLAALAGTLATDEAQMDSLGVNFTGQTAQVQTIAVAVAKLQQSIRSVVNNDLTLATSNLQKMDAMIAQFQAQLKTVPAESLQVVALTRASDVFGQLYVLLMQKEEEAEVSKAATIVDTRIVLPAEVPLGASAPQPVINTVIGAMVGLLAGCGAALGQRTLSGSFQTDDEIRRLVKIPVSGMLPRRRRAEVSAGFFPAASQGPFAEAFRLVRGNVYESSGGKPSNIVLITSASVGDGKTTIAANLAKTLADDGKRVILVDGDMRIGSVQRAIGPAPTPGLSEWLATGRRPPIQRFPDQQFAVLPSGALPPNPAELVNRAYFAEILRTLRAEFDYVILDSPPLPVVAEGFSMAKHADMVISVVRTGHTPRRPFVIHNEMLAKLDRPRSIIINGVMEASYGYGYSYKYTYRAPAAPRGLLGGRRAGRPRK